MSAGCSSARQSTGRSPSARAAPTTSRTAASRARTRSRRSRRTRRSTCCRTDGFEHVADIMVGSFYDPDLDEGCAFEELISFHGGIGGLQTRPFILHPTHLEVPPGPILGAASVHGILAGWRQAAPGRRDADSRRGSGRPSGLARPGRSGFAPGDPHARLVFGRRGFRGVFCSVARRERWGRSAGGIGDRSARGLGGCPRPLRGVRQQPGRDRLRGLAPRRIARPQVPDRKAAAPPELCGADPALSGHGARLLRRP